FYTYEDMFVNGYSSKDRDIYRYAEALLLGAEAIAQSQGVTAEAAKYLAEIKARANMAGKSAATIATELAALSKDAFIEECWKERLRELPFDFKIWDDIVRTKKFPVISTTTKGDVKFVDTFNGTTTNASGYTIKASDMLWPISPDEIQRNPSLTQNEGYK
ncbi:MAG: RagB/SusD family nutrient uptake outer membrane protein, partial [Bacteroidales bacterium]|nr:RagB/SusD family nutrient uptake outer membrane protein [Bacteroidales bacterium]